MFPPVAPTPTPAAPQLPAPALSKSSTKKSSHLLLPSPPKPSPRGTLSEQLASITRVVEGVTAGLQGRCSTPGVSEGERGKSSGAASMVVLPALHLRVGRVTSRRGAPVHLLGDRCEFVFALGGSCEVSMTMYFRDIAPSTHASGSSVSFRVRGGENMAAFKGDYDEKVHSITLTFHAPFVAREFCKAVRHPPTPP